MCKVHDFKQISSHTSKISNLAITQNFDNSSFKKNDLRPFSWSVHYFAVIKNLIIINNRITARERARVANLGQAHIYRVQEMHAPRIFRSRMPYAFLRDPETLFCFISLVQLTLFSWNFSYISTKAFIVPHFNIYVIVLPAANSTRVTFYQDCFKFE